MVIKEKRAKCSKKRIKPSLRGCSAVWKLEWKRFFCPIRAKSVFAYGERYAVRPYKGVDQHPVVREHTEA